MPCAGAIAFADALTPPLATALRRTRYWRGRGAYRRQDRSRFADSGGANGVDGCQPHVCACCHALAPHPADDRDLLPFIRRP
jgi:hypothetical protein